MSPLPKSILKTFFEIGDRPTEQQFALMIESTLNLVDDRFLLGLKEHDVTVQYTAGDTVIYNGLIYEALISSVGAFIPSQWKKLNFGAVNYAGTWNAFDNDPVLASGTGNRGDYYVINQAGNTDLDGETDWKVRDWAVYNGTKWEKVDNSDLDVQTAAMVSFDNTVSGIVSDNVQGAIDEVETRVDTAETGIDTIQNTKANKVAGATAGNFATLSATGDLTDAGKKPDDYLHKGNTTAFTPSLPYDPATKTYVDGLIDNVNASSVEYTPSGDLTSTNVQGAIDELELNKQDALGFTPVPDTRTINGQALSSDITLTKANIGLGNVDNTSDVNKPISTAVSTALAGKQDTITTGTTAQYFRGDLTLATLDKTAVGLANVDNTSDADKPVSTAVATALSGKQNTITTGTTAQYFRGDLTLATLDKTAVGLANVDNTSDADKPVSTAVATALSGKQNTITTGTTAQYFRGDLSLGDFTGSTVGLANVTNDQQISLKFYFATEGTAAVATSTTTGFVTGVSNSFTPAVAADYLIEWYFELSNSSSGGAYGAQVSVDGTVYSTNINFPALAASYMGFSGAVKLNLTAASHTVLIEINRPAGNGTVSFRRPRVLVKKV